LLRPPPLQQALLDQSPHNVGEGRPIYASEIDNVRLAQPFVPGHPGEHCQPTGVRSLSPTCAWNISSTTCDALCSRCAGDRSSAPFLFDAIVYLPCSELILGHTFRRCPAHPFVAWRRVAAMSETITSMGLTATDELDALVSRVADHLARPETMTISFSMVQVVGRLPG
jgi:hypothetical protein